MPRLGGLGLDHGVGDRWFVFTHELSRGRGQDFVFNFIEGEIDRSAGWNWAAIFWSEVVFGLALIQALVSLEGVVDKGDWAVGVVVVGGGVGAQLSFFCEAE